jgi:hypothetical protein
MRCYFCDGTGVRKEAGGSSPCPECGGCGFSHCCDGLQACCEIEGDPALRKARDTLDVGASAPERDRPLDDRPCL